ncbi:hypothetical protein J3459_012161 [Metarhizium acridum]|uniref:uncharacterized protein n=1 Tax=Metarhizium acridum TaxID=92637 RepID=UPI001C6C3637|nr:hypothetical protein J3458_021253 [Metarhizium acridum]KAG8418640.1 hypothetical protein J3459_012161 [Metarhizium acridum]
MPPKREDAGVLDQKRQDGSYSQPQPSSPATVPPASSPTSTAAIIAGPSTTSDPAERAPTYEEATEAKGGVPTVDSPFNFPTSTDLPPSYEAHAEAEAGPSSSKSVRTKPVAIPQVAPEPAAPFLPAYPPSLLAHGITEQTWRSFLDTVSAFLTAKVSGRAIAHAGDMAKSLGEPPKNYGKSLVNHTKSVGKQLVKDARRFDVFGVAAGVIGGAISIPMHAAFGAVDTIFQIPGTAVSAISKTPRTPLQRAATYSAVASKDWLNARGLHAVLLDTRQLAEMIHVPGSKFLEMAAEGAKSGTAAATMCALGGHIEKLNMLEDEVVVLSDRSLWLVLVPVVKEDEEKQGTK